MHLLSIIIMKQDILLITMNIYLLYINPSSNFVTIISSLNQFMIDINRFHISAFQTFLNFIKFSILLNLDNSKIGLTTESSNS